MRKIQKRMSQLLLKLENIQILKLINEKNIIVVKGDVPETKNSYLIIEK